MNCKKGWLILKWESETVLHWYTNCKTLLIFTVDTWTVAFSPDSRFIATGSHAGKINLIGVESGKKESALDTRGKFTMSIAYVSSCWRIIIIIIELYSLYWLLFCFVFFFTCICKWYSTLAELPVSCQKPLHIAESHDWQMQAPFPMSFLSEKCS